MELDVAGGTHEPLALIPHEGSQISHGTTFDLDRDDFDRLGLRGNLSIAVLGQRVAEGPGGYEGPPRLHLSVECDAGVDVRMSASRQVVLAGVQTFESMLQAQAGFEASVTYEGRLDAEFTSPQVQLVAVSEGHMMGAVGLDTLRVDHPNGTSMWDMGAQGTFAIQDGPGAYGLVLTRVAAAEFEGVGNHCAPPVCIRSDWFRLVMAGWHPVSRPQDVYQLPGFA